MSSSGQIHKISISTQKGNKKNNVVQVTLKEQVGIVGDAHAGSERQVSLLPFESFDIVREKLATIAPGDFAENITTVGLDFTNATIGARLQLGPEAQLEITQIGKECHQGCYIREAVGDCIMPKLGVFAAVIKGGTVSAGDEIRWLRR